MEVFSMCQQGVEMAANKKTPGDTIRVFLYLCYEMDCSGWVEMTQKRIAENMDITREQVATATSTLVQLGAITKENHPTTDRQAIKVNHDFANKDKKWLVDADDIDWVKREGGGYLD